jgi:hypothetical protein
LVKHAGLAVASGEDSEIDLPFWTSPGAPLGVSITTNDIVRCYK